MHKLLVENDWFVPVQPNGLADTVYSEMLLARAAVLFPDFALAPVKYRIGNDRGQCAPHLVLVDQRYRSWWLVLLESGTAPTSAYLTSQAEVARAHRYGRDFVDHVVAACAALNGPLLVNLVRDEMPGLYVVIGHPPAPLMDVQHIRVGIAEVFQSGHGGRILRINGDQPTVPAYEVGVCTRNLRVQPNLLCLKVRDPAADKIQGSLAIEVNGAQSMWIARAVGPDIFLVPEGATSLPVDQEIFKLLRSPGGQLRLEPQDG